MTARNSCTESIGEETSDSRKEIDRGRKKKEKLVGKKKERWSKDEKNLLWECFAQSGVVRCGGYISKLN